MAGVVYKNGTVNVKDRPTAPFRGNPREPGFYKGKLGSSPQQTGGEGDLLTTEITGLGSVLGADPTINSLIPKDASHMIDSDAKFRGLNRAQGGVDGAAGEANNTNNGGTSFTDQKEKLNTTNLGQAGTATTPAGATYSYKPGEGVSKTGGTPMTNNTNFIDMSHFGDVQKSQNAQAAVNSMKGDSFFGKQEAATASQKLALFNGMMNVGKPQQAPAQQGLGYTAPAQTTSIAPTREQQAHIEDVMSRLGGGTSLRAQQLGAQMTKEIMDNNISARGQDISAANAAMGVNASMHNADVSANASLGQHSAANAIATAELQRKLGQDSQAQQNWTAKQKAEAKDQALRFAQFGNTMDQQKAQAEATKNSNVSKVLGDIAGSNEDMMKQHPEEASFQRFQQILSANNGDVADSIDKTLNLSPITASAAQAYARAMKAANGDETNPDVVKTKAELYAKATWLPTALGSQ
jgi:hypothetical protein